MSSDQQYPYGQQQPYGGPESHGDRPPRGDQQSYADQQGYGDQQSYGDQQGYGNAPYGGQAHGDRPHQQQSYGEGAPYDPHAPGTPAPGAPAGADWPAHQGHRPPASPDHGQPDQGAAQTWQGQTWDTQYQPTVQRAQGRPPQAQPVQQAAVGGGYPQAPGAPGAYPLPPEVPVGTPAPGPGPAAGHAAPAPDAAPGGAGYSAPTTLGNSRITDAQRARAEGRSPVIAPGTQPAASPAPDAAPGGAGYSAPTTLGNSRITDAQRARAEGRSPVIAPGTQPAAITAGLGLLLALGAAIGPYALLVPLVLLQAVTAAGWFRLNGMWPARQGIALAFAGGLVADAVLLAAGRENGPAAILGTLGVWVLLTFVLQLRSHAGADERMYGLMASVASASLTVLAAGHLAAVPEAVTVGAVAVAAAVLARALPLPGAVSVVVALLVAAGAGAAMGAFTDFGAQGAFLGFAAGGCALIGLRVASYDYPSRFVHMTAGVALPLTVAAPAVYLIGRAIG